MPNGYAFIKALCIINWALLIFNMLPIYPLDGGPDPAIASLVCAGARAEPDGDDYYRLHRRGGR